MLQKFLNILEENMSLLLEVVDGHCHNNHRIEMVFIPDSPSGKHILGFRFSHSYASSI